MERQNISDISRRNNIIYKKTSSKEVVLYEDHRSILNVLFYLKLVRDIDTPLDLVMFDDHDDFLTPHKGPLKKIVNFLKKPSQEKLNQIVEFDLSSRDDDWVKAGMELGIIGNVFLFNSTKCTLGFREEYKTKKFGTKCLYNIGDVWAALGYQGILTDTHKYYLKPLWDDLGWEYKDNRFSFKKERNKYVFDIDLDCFSTTVWDETISVPEDIFFHKLTEIRNPINSSYYDCQSFMKDLIKDSELVTICFENGCCGGIRQSQKIFNMVDCLLFDNEIGK